MKKLLEQLKQQDLILQVAIVMMVVGVGIVAILVVLAILFLFRESFILGSIATAVLFIVVGGGLLGIHKGVNY